MNKSLTQVPKQVLQILQNFHDKHKFTTRENTLVLLNSMVGAMSIFPGFGLSDRLSSECSKNNEKDSSDMVAINRAIHYLVVSSVLLLFTPLLVHDSFITNGYNAVMKRKLVRYLMLMAGVTYFSCSVYINVKCPNKLAGCKMFDTQLCPRKVALGNGVLVLGIGIAHAWLGDQLPENSEMSMDSSDEMESRKND
jgi:hypothetical protein